MLFFSSAHFLIYLLLFSPSSEIGSSALLIEYFINFPSIFLPTHRERERERDYQRKERMGERNSKRKKLIFSALMILHTSFALLLFFITTDTISTPTLTFLFFLSLSFPSSLSSSFPSSSLSSSPSKSYSASSTKVLLTFALVFAWILKRKKGVRMEREREKRRKRGETREEKRNHFPLIFILLNKQKKIVIVTFAPVSHKYCPAKERELSK